MTSAFRGLRRSPLLHGLQGLAVLATLGGLVAFGPASAQVKTAAPTTANYKQAKKYSTANLTPLTYSTAVTPGWIGKTDEFWYAYRTSKGNRYWRVDPEKKTKAPLFDHEKLAAQLAELSRKPVDAATLNLSGGRVSEAGKFTFVAGQRRYEYDLTAEKLVDRGKAPAGGGFPDGTPGKGKGKGKGKGIRRTSGEDEAQVGEKKDDDKKDEKKDDTDDRTRGGGPRQFDLNRPTKSVSPDKKAVLFTQQRNLFLAEAGKEKEAIQLSKDSAENYGFVVGTGTAGGTTRTNRTGPPSGPPPSVWSKDSKYFYATRVDVRGVKELFVINSLATPRPKLENYKYSMPGEDAIRKSELHVGSVASKRIVRVKPKWRDEIYSDFHWGKEPGELRFVRLDRLRRNLEFCAVNAETGECKTLISEGFENAPVYHQRPRYLDETDEMLWWSEKSGWGHYYLYSRDGKLKNAVTSGPWRCSRIVELDAKKRELYVLGNAREKGENVYYQHLYRVQLDGSGLTLLDPGDANMVRPGPAGGGGGSYLSPSRKFVVVNSSRVDRAPDSVVRDASGKLVMPLEKADLSRLLEYGWRLPETFTVKAADGVTDLYGNLWKPFDFDPKKSYPIIAHVYPGPQTEGVTHTFSVFGTNQQLAQLGFIVIQVGHRGGAPTRSKAYGSFGYFNLRDYGLADKKTAIEQLAARYPWIDIKRVGIYGHSGGGFMSAAALLVRPYNEFFKVAVASAGNHDNNIYNNYWSELHHGLREVPVKDAGKAVAKDATKGKDEKGTPVAPPPATKFEIRVPTNAELASNLKGRLLLVHGEMDNNVHPAQTMRLADALIKANKRFDMLIIPGKRHGFADAQPYFTRRMWEYFAEHLIGDRRGSADLFDADSE